MFLKTYRFYQLDGVGRLHLAEWFEAENDAQAIALIESQHADARCEIWQDHRLVTQLSPTRLEA